VLLVFAFRFVQLVLKHRQGKNHRMRIVVFVGSPIEDDEKEVCLSCVIVSKSESDQIDKLPL